MTWMSAPTPLSLALTAAWAAGCPWTALELRESARLRPGDRNHRPRVVRTALRGVRPAGALKMVPAPARKGPLVQPIGTVNDKALAELGWATLCRELAARARTPMGRERCLALLPGDDPEASSLLRQISL